MPRFISHLGFSYLQALSPKIPQNALCSMPMGQRAAWLGSLAQSGSPGPGLLHTFWGLSLVMGLSLESALCYLSALCLFQQHKELGWGMCRKKYDSSQGLSALGISANNPLGLSSSQEQRPPCFLKGLHTSLLYSSASGFSRFPCRGGETQWMPPSQSWWLLTLWKTERAHPGGARVGGGVGGWGGVEPEIQRRG